MGMINKNKGISFLWLRNYFFPFFFFFKFVINYLLKEMLQFLGVWLAALVTIHFHCLFSLSIQMNSDWAALRLLSTFFFASPSFSHRKEVIQVCKNIMAKHVNFKVKGELLFLFIFYIFEIPWLVHFRPP